jgi:hypothetical protein
MCPDDVETLAGAVKDLRPIDDLQEGATVNDDKRVMSTRSTARPC